MDHKSPSAISVLGFPFWSVCTFFVVVTVVLQVAESYSKTGLTLPLKILFLAQSVRSLGPQIFFRSSQRYVTAAALMTNVTYKGKLILFDSVHVIIGYRVVYDCNLGRWPPLSELFIFTINFFYFFLRVEVGCWSVAKDRGIRSWWGL